MSHGYEIEVPTYKYITTDLMTGDVLSDLPLTSVSYESGLKSAGALSGSLPVLSETEAYDTYHSTLPGKTALYVLRNDECVWGGIVWSRSYSANERTLQIQASEFTSYLHHRLMWRTYNHAYTADGVASGEVLTVTLSDGTFYFSTGYPLRVSFYSAEDIQYDDYYNAASGGQDTFTVAVPGLPDGSYTGLTVTTHVDTYDYVRSMLDHLAVDFSDLDYSIYTEPIKTTSFEIIEIETPPSVGTPTYIDVTTSEAHDFIVGQSATISNVSNETYFIEPGAYKVVSIGDTTARLFNDDGLITGVIPAATSVLGFTGTVVGKTLTNSVALIRTATNGLNNEDVIHVAGVDATFNGTHTVYRHEPVIEITNVTAVLPTSATFTTSVDHFLEVNDWVEIFGISPNEYNGVMQVTAVSHAGPYTFTGGIGAAPGTVTANTGTAIPKYMYIYTLEGSPADVSYTVVSPAGTFNRYQNLNNLSAGPFTSLNLVGQPTKNYSDIGFVYDPATAYSGISTANRTSRGYELRSVGQDLDEYADIEEGFEYRVDCSYVPGTYATTYKGSFLKTFKMFPVIYPNTPVDGVVPTLEAIGADRFIFEYPGNVSDLTMDESAENSATRFFVTGNTSDLGQDAAQPYAAAAATDLLDTGWPLLDAETSSQDIYDEDTLYSSAQRYLQEFRPPVSDIRISVNGSIAPTVGTYRPGDWCGIIIDDPFVKLRLSSVLEPRDNIIVRKIETIKVTVPDGVNVPEQVELLLVRE